jgi:hypothetical protein
MPEDGPGHVEGAGEIGANHLLPVQQAHLLGRAVARGTSVVDEVIEPPVLVQDLVDNPLAVPWITHIRLMD